MRAITPQRGRLARIEIDATVVLDDVVIGAVDHGERLLPDGGRDRRGMVGR